MLGRKFRMRGVGVRAVYVSTAARCVILGHCASDVCVVASEWRGRVADDSSIKCGLESRFESAEG